MASGDPVKELCEELACPICLEYFKEPVILSCGHNFCQSCLDQCWEEKGASCPQCREKVQERDIRPNRQLANLVEIAKKLGSQKAEEKGIVCQRHQEPLKLFCKDHKAPICVVCDKSKEHEKHKVIPLDEASKEFKDQIWNLLEPLKEEREKILAYKANTEKEIDDVLEETQIWKEKIVSEFRLMHQFLEERERNLLAEMEETEKAIRAKREEHLARLSEELSSISSLMQEMEKKHQQPASELLQDIGSFFQGYQKREKCETPVVFPPDLKWKIWDFRDIPPFLEGIMKQCRDSLESGLHWKKAHVTLNPDTAHPRLILSEDRRHVTWGKRRHYLPDNPERFTRYPCVLGQEGFTGGRHFWEVLVGSEERWSVGVARKSVERGCSHSFGPKSSGMWESERAHTGFGFWDVGKLGGAYRFTSDKDVNARLTLSEEPKRIRVTLNYEEGRVAFYDADSAALIFEYPPASFSGETLLPFFHVKEKAQLELSP